MRGLICLAFLGCVVTAPAVAQTHCVAPDTPADIDGTTVTLDELKAAIGAAKQFMTKSDTFQACLGKEVQANKAAPNANKPVDTTIEARDRALADANQQAKENVGASVNAAIAAYKKTHAAK